MNAIKTEDLVRFLYNETTTEETLKIESALLYDFQLKEEYNQLKETVDELMEFSCSPSEKTIESILSYK